MDPNATHAMLLGLCGTVRQMERDGIDPPTNLAADFGEYFEALDQWLRKGGFLPDAWRSGQTSQS